MAHLTQKELDTVPNVQRQVEAVVEYDNDRPTMSFIASTPWAGVQEVPLLKRRVGMYFSGDSTDEPELAGLGEFEITYSFSSAIRPHLFPTMDALGRVQMIQYGQPMSYRMLYSLLCEVWNGGDYFIDDYFEKRFKQRPVYERFTKMRDTLRRRMATELYQMKLQASKNPRARLQDQRGLLSSAKRFAVEDIAVEYERLFQKYGWATFKVWNDSHIRAEKDILASAIAEDIAHTLRSGQMPLARQTVAERTTEIRSGIPAMASLHQLFFATGSLIQHIKIFINLEKEAA